MKKYIVLAAIAFIGCNGHKNHDPVSLVRSFQNTGNWDSVYLYSDGHLVIVPQKDSIEIKVEPERYLLFSYSSKLKKSDRIIYGNAWFSCDKFPTKTEIDSIVYNSFNYKRECYEHVIITSIYEFKGASDFYRFSFDYKDGDIPPVNQKSCK